jgi:hypothetical protein
MKNFSIIFLLFLFFSCSNEEETPSCGCNSPTINTIPNEDLTNVPIEEQKTGVIFFKDDGIQDPYLQDEEFNNRFWIFQGTEGCNNCQRKFIVCNEGLLGEEFDYLKQLSNNDSIAVKFSGNLKDECTEPFIVPGDFFYAEIVLTSIEKIN